MAETELGQIDGLSSIDIHLREYESSAPLDLSEDAERMLRTEINGGRERTGSRIEVAYDRDGLATLTATQYVGVVSLPDGPTIQIRPKAAGTNLLSLLRFARDVDPTTFDRETRMEAGDTFVEPLAILFERELRTVIQQGLHREYHRIDGQEDRLRGQLQVQRQLQRQGPTPTRFECRYSDLTYDTVANQGILYATTLLQRLVTDQELQQRLHQHQAILRQRVSLRRVDPNELDRLSVSHLNRYYEDLLRLTELIVRGVFIDDLATGTRGTFALLVNMNTIFEAVVERALRDALAERAGWTVKGQYTTQQLVTGGNHTVTIRPDIVVLDPSDEVRFVGDAKWKLGAPSNSDFYQMSAYQLAHDCPGALIYPEQDGVVESNCLINGSHRLELIELPTRSLAQGFKEYTERLQRSLEERVTGLIGE
ncbi:McrC family protein [Halomarina salina]|uniref:McrC family protein n=1 Tax=Halomarina salina TaxID=1872699 RepID=A0ABD5RTN9_9EURY|nr:McrC family protein [Halomarina salina]